MKEILEQVPEEVSPGVKNVEGKTWSEPVAIALIRGAVEGNSAHVKELLERIEGKVTQPIQQEADPQLLDLLEKLDQGEAKIRQA